MYHNIKMTDMSGETLAYVDRKRMQWYIARGLGKAVSDNEFRLTFEPKARGQSYKIETLPRQNVCVACGLNQRLERHHVVPYCFRRYFDERYKNHNSHDVVALCVDCHTKYERYGNKEKDVLRNRYSTKVKRDPQVLAQIKRLALLINPPPNLPQNILDRTRSALPPEVRDDINAATSYRESLVKELSVGDEWAKNVVVSLGEEALILFWREHFLRYARPAYIPEVWVMESQLVLTKE